MTSQTSTIFELLDEAKARLVKQLSRFETYDEGHNYPWENRLWRSDTFRRAHLDVVDVRDTKKLYMMHLTVFPHTDDGAPIFGFDLIAGPTKVTGAFHDFSPIDKTHSLCEWYAEAVEPYTWSKPRALPGWATKIFSTNMIAAGNISDPAELRTVLDLVEANLAKYLSRVGTQRGGNFAESQNQYCFWQKQNPHTPRVMQSLGFDEEVVHEFIHQCLFPELEATV